MGVVATAREVWRAASARADGVEDRNYTDAITQAIIAAAADAAADGYVAGLEVAAGQLSRAFASATLEGPEAELLTPEIMAQIGRQLVEHGEAVWFRIGRRLERAIGYTINDRTRAYTLELRNSRSVVVPMDRTLHVRWNVEPTTLRGVAPLATARTLRQLLGKLEVSMRDEANAAVGYLLPMPADGAATQVDKLRSDIADLKGRIAVVETMQGGWGTGTPGAPRRDYELARLGPNFPAANVDLYRQAHNVVLAACGYPVQLATDSDGTAQREAWRRYLHGTVAPLGRLVATAADAAGVRVTLEFDQLFASDISGRARAFQSLVGGGMSIEAAAAASGLLDREE